MKLNLIMEGSHNASRQHTLHVMREMLLSGQYAPMNVDLFYDQFFNPALLSPSATQALDATKSAWLDAFDHFTCYIDHGLDADTDTQLKALQQQHPKATFEYGLLQGNRGILLENAHADLRDAYFFRCAEDPAFADMLSFVTNSTLSQIPLPDHLPEHFITHTSVDAHRHTPQTKPRDRVIFESPFAGDMKSNTDYAAQAIAKLVMQEGVAPMASHLLYTRMLDDTNPQERNIGIDAGLAYGRHAQGTIVALDRGMSTGMRYGIDNAINADRPLSFLTLSDNPEIQASTQEIKSVDDALHWIGEVQKAAPRKHFENTGFITPIPNLATPNNPTESHLSQRRKA